MNSGKRVLASLCATAVLLGAAGCSGMTNQQRDTAIGAGVGGLAGSVLTEGSAIGTVGGAVVGGAIGHETSKNGK